MFFFGIFDIWTFKICISYLLVIYSKQSPYFDNERLTTALASQQRLVKQG